MRPVSGLERPGLQWAFLALGVILVVLAAGEAIGLRRARAQMETLRAANLSARLDRDALQARATREQAAREALTLELGKVRGDAAPITQPTLTLSPLTRRAAQPPEATVTSPPANQAIQLRLILPAGAPQGSQYSIAVRSWTGGDTLWSRTGLAASTPERQPMVTAFVTGDVFAPGAYEIALSSNNGGKIADVAAYEIAVRTTDR